MAASTKSRAPSLGHYLLPLTMNKGHINPKQAEYHIEVKTKYLDLKKHRPERHALRNLLGMLHFRLGKFDESLAFFDKILSDREDPENLNALANRKYICDKLYRIPESRDCEQKISELLPDNYQNEEEESRLHRARSLAEQAFAYSFDVFDESVTAERYRTSVDLYEEAFELAGDSLTQDEREDWMISKGMACHKIFDKVKRNKTLQNDARDYYGKAVNIFICTKDANNDILKSESWRHLGELIQESSKFSIPVPDSLTRYVGEPIKCFEEALDSTPRDPKMLARYARFLQTNHRLEEASMYVNKSIQLDETVFNSFAFSIREQVFLQDYTNQLTDYMKFNRSNQPDESLLKRAQKDLKKLSEIHSTPIDLQKLAQVYYYMATGYHGKVKEGYDEQKYLQQALTMCAKAAACQDGKKRSDVHKIRAQSLCALGEHQQALRSFKRAVECEVSSNWLSHSGIYLTLEYAHVLEDMTDAQPSSYPTLFADMVYWLHKAAKINLINPRWSGSICADTHLATFWKSFVEYCKENNYMRELEDIKEASLYPDQRRNQQRRTDEESPHMSQSQSVTEVASGTTHANSELHPSLSLTEAAKAPLYVVPQKRCMQSVIKGASGTTHVNSGEDHNPHVPTEDAKGPMYVAPHKRQTQSVTEEASGTTWVLAEKYHPQVHIKSTIASLSALELGGDKTPSEAKPITSTVNLKTGKTQFVNQTSSSQEWTSKDASNKPIRSAPKKAFNRVLLNDFFVIHSSSASEWVFRCLLEELEESDLKGCIKDRDFMIGKTKLANYTDSIANSACVVIVITEDFANDDWCNHSMVMAIEQNKLLIPVLREDTKLPMFLTTLTHLDATGAMDWERLKRSIEQQIRLDDA